MNSCHISSSDESFWVRADGFLVGAAMEAKGAAAWQPDRQRKVSMALQAYGALTTSAARGAVRDVSQLRRR